MQNRIKELRKFFGLTQTAFGDKIGITRNAVNNVENGRVDPSEIFIKSVCREFGVNENWFRYGEGEMLPPSSKAEEISSFLGEVLSDEDSFKFRLVSILSRLGEDDWARLADIAVELTAKEKDQG